MKSDSRGPGQVFWATADEQGLPRNRSATFELKHDGGWHAYASGYRWRSL